MMSVRPHRNRIYETEIYVLLDRGFSVGVKEARRTFPRASKAPSKKSSTPSMINIPPNEVRATPISVTGFEKWNQLFVE